jgi:outer membrane protein assembly factor BamB
MRARLYLIAGAILFLSALMIAAGLPGSARWASLGGGFQRNGRSADGGPAAGCIWWQFEVGGAVTGSTTVGWDGRVYVPCEDGRLYAIDADGEALWTLDVNTPLLSAPSIAPDGTLYVGGRDGRLRAVTPDGSLLWAFDTGGAVCSSPAIASTGDVYVASTDGTLYAVGADGVELWRFTPDGPVNLPAGAIFASPAIGTEGTVYIGGLYDPNLYALNPQDGSVKWACSFGSADDSAGGWPFVSPVIGDDGTIYQMLLYDSRLYAIEPAGGTILWAADLLDLSAFGVLPEDIDSQGDGWSEPVIGPDGMIYVSLDDPYLRAVNPDGSLRWAQRLGDPGGFTLTVDKNGQVYAAGDDGWVYVVDADGLEVSRFEAGGWPAFPVIAAEDLLIAADCRDYSSLNADATNLVKGMASSCVPITLLPKMSPSSSLPR